MSGEAMRGFSEGQLLEICQKSVQSCRDALEELRTLVKDARSHREKCGALLAAATTAVMNLEDLLYSQDIDLNKERQLQQLSTAVRTAVIQGQAKVRVYGQMGALGKLTNRLFAADTYAKFDELTQELGQLARQGHKVLEMPSQPSPPQRLASGGSAAAVGRASPPPPAFAAAAAAPVMSTQTSGGAVSTSSVAPTEATVATDVPPQPATMASGSPPTSAATSFFPAGIDSLTKRSFIQRNVPMPVEALQRQRLYRGSRGQAVTAMLYAPPALDAPPGNMGRMWYYVSRAFSGGMYVHDLSSQVSQEVKEAKADNVVTAVHLDTADGRLWTGHKRGYVRVWDEALRQPLCEPLQVFNSHVRALTTDENGLAWAGSESGNVKCLALEEVVRDGVRINTMLVVKGTLKWAGPGMPDVTSGISSGGEGGWVDSKHLKEPAHYGTVTSVAAAVGRVWTAGGSSAFVCLREWSQRGEFLASTDLRSVGTANMMLITSPIVRVMTPGDRAPSLTASVVSTRVAGGMAAQQGEIPQFWQLLTAHDSGLIQVWTLIANVLKPILRIGDRMAPAKSIVVCEQLGAVCTAHTDGRLLVRTLPHPKGPTGLTVTYGPNSVSAVKLTFAELEASKTGLALADGGMVGVITASNNATITLWPEGVLREAAQGKGLALTSEHSPREQWPLVCYSSAEATTGVLQLAMSETSSPELAGSGEIGSRDLAGAAASQPMMPRQSGMSNARKQSLFEQSGAAFDWRIDYSDMTLIKVIGEGAIGKVWLGRFQETDVAIKQLNSLGQLVGGAAQQQGAGGAGMGSNISHDVLRTLEREVGILVRIRHPNVILFMGVCLEPPCVVTEYCARGSLYDVLKLARHSPAMSKQLDWGKRLSMAMDAAKGMYHLHSHKPAIIHRDLKSPNLLVDKHWRVKVTDFNLSRITETGPAVQSSLTANNPRWLAPEVILRQAFSRASDVYAFGLILWELITWEVPFKEMSQFQIMMAVTQQHQRPEVPDQYTQEVPGGMFPLYVQYCDLMRWCWAEDPEQRPSMDQVIAELRMMLEQMTQRARAQGSASRRFSAPGSAAAERPAGAAFAPAGAAVTTLAAHALAAPAASSQEPNGGGGSSGPVGPRHAHSASVPSGVAGPFGATGPFASTGPFAAEPPRAVEQPGAAAAAAVPGFVMQAAQARGSPFDSAASVAADGPAAEASTASSSAVPAAAVAGAMPAASPFDSAPSGLSAAPSSVIEPSPSGALEASPPAAGGGLVTGAAITTMTPAQAGAAALRETEEVSFRTLEQGQGSASRVDSGGGAASPSEVAVAAAGGAAAGAATQAPPSPFGGFVPPPSAPPTPEVQQPLQPAGPAADGPTAASRPPPSPFGGDFVLPAVTLAQTGTARSSSMPPPSPFSDGGFSIPQPAAAAAAVAPQRLGTMRSASVPPPSPFGGGFTLPATGGTAPPPSPFDAPGPSTAGAAAAGQAGPSVDLRNIDSVENNAGMSPNSSHSHSGPVAAAAAAAAASPPGAQGPGAPPPQRPLAHHQSLDPSAVAEQACEGEEAEEEEEEGGEQAGSGGGSSGAYKRSITAPGKLMRKFRGFGGGRTGDK